MTTLKAIINPSIDSKQAKCWYFPLGGTPVEVIHEEENVYRIVNEPFTRMEKVEPLIYDYDLTFEKDEIHK